VRPAVALISGGKDSIYATHLALWQGFDVRAAATVVPHPDSWILQYENVSFAGKHAEALGLPWIVRESPAGEESELNAIRSVLEDVVDRHGVKWVILGALASEYQRIRFNYVARDLGLKVHTPLWHLEPRGYMKRLTRDGFEFIITRVAADGLGTEWLGRRITEENVDELISLSEEHSFNLAGEGGEYETFVVKTPLYDLDVRGRIQGTRFVIKGVNVLDYH